MTTPIPAVWARGRWVAATLLLTLVILLASVLCDPAAAKTLSELGTDTKSQVKSSASGFYYAGVMVGAIAIMIVAWRRWVAILMFMLMAGATGALVLHPEKTMGSISEMFMGLFT